MGSGIASSSLSASLQQNNVTLSPFPKGVLRGSLPHRSGAALKGGTRSLTSALVRDLLCLCKALHSALAPQPAEGNPAGSMDLFCCPQSGAAVSSGAFIVQRCLSVKPAQNGDFPVMPLEKALWCLPAPLGMQDLRCPSLSSHQTHSFNNQL